MSKRQNPESPSVLKVFLFTDLVGSTALKRKHGDPAYAVAIANHNELFRRNLSHFEGTEHVSTGDGFLAIFDVPSQAVRCALSFQQELAGIDSPEPLKIRFGIHLGEAVTIPEGDSKRDQLVGFAIDIAARVMGLAQGGQILLTRAAFDSARQQIEAVRDGSPLEWLAHGPYQLKGVEEPIDLFEVGISGLSPLAPPPDSEKAKRGVRLGDEITLGWRPAVALAIPQRRNWKLIEKLGEGGFGEVWLAGHEKTHEKRVFKFCFQADRLRGLKREIVLFRLLKETLGDRDDIARILEWQFDQPPFFIEGEYTKGGSLLEWAEAHGGISEVPRATRLEIVAQAAGALAAAHSVGILHKDIKPGNILIEERAEGPPRTLLTDFGIGLITDRRLLEEKGITATGLTEFIATSDSASGSGTRLYMAPEVIEGKPPTTLSDVYALGVLLYQMVAGDFSRALATGWDRDIDDEILREDIASCVDGLPERRLASASELSTLLRNLEQRRAERQAVQRSEEQAARAKLAAQKAHRRHRILGAAGIVAALILVILSYIALRERRRADQEFELRERAVAAERHARTQSTVARYTTQFMVGLFSFSDPFRDSDLSAESSNNLTARRILDDGAERIGRDLGLDPKVKAALLDSMGRAYVGLGLYVEALPLFEESLQTRKNNREGRDLGLSTSLENLGFLAYKQGKYEVAEPYLRQALELYRNQPEVPEREVARTLFCLAGSTAGLGDIMRAEELYDEALTLRRKLLGPNHPEVAEVLVSLANLNRDKGDLEEAERLYIAALAMQRSVLPNDHPEIGRTLNNLANFLWQEKKDFEAADSLYREAIKIQRERLGPNHPVLLREIANLGLLLAVRASGAYFEGNIAEAVEIYRESVELKRELLGEQSPSLAESLDALAGLLREMKNFEEAEELLRQAISIAEQSLGKNHSATRRYQRNLENLLGISPVREPQGARKG